MNAHPLPVHLVALFDDQATATRVVERLIEDDFPMDRISVLHKRGSGHGDDPLGLSFTGAGQRMQVWGEQGLLWGAIGGLLAGLSGLFLVPGIGALLAAGPITEALGWAVAGGATMAGAAALSEVATAFHRLGLPKERLEHIEKAIQDGRYVLMLHAEPGEIERLRPRVAMTGAKEVILL